MTDGSTPQPRRRGFNRADDPATGERRPALDRILAGCHSFELVSRSHQHDARRPLPTTGADVRQSARSVAARHGVE